MNLLELQKELRALSIPKNGYNPHFKSNYAELADVLDAVVPVLNKHDLVLLQPLTSIGDLPAVRTLIHNAKEHVDVIDETTPIIMDRVTPQAAGSGITYTKRYAILAALGLTAGDPDDDANVAEGLSEKKEPNAKSNKDEERGTVL